MYTPDNWVIIYFKGDTPHYKVLAGWSGGYTTGDSWRMNSGITKIEYDGDRYYFYGASGSCYTGHKHGYGLRVNNAYIWNQLSELYGDDVELMDEDTNWMDLELGIS